MTEHRRRVGMRVILAFVASLGLSAVQAEVIYTADLPPQTPRLEDLPKMQSISQYGITWTFDGQVPVGQFVNGDYYVVGPATVRAIDPAPLIGADVPADQVADNREKDRPQAERVRNGSMVDPPAAGEVAYDSRIRNAFRPNLIARLPIVLQPGQSLVSTISYEKVGQTRRMLNSGQRTVSPVRTAAVLTCLAAPAPPDAFRPCYAKGPRPMYLARHLRRDLLPSYGRVSATPPLAEWERVFERPWLDTVFFGFGAPEQNMPDYGREIAQAAGIGALMLCTDFTPQEKEKLLVRYVQVGIDEWGLLQGGYPGWQAHGGHGNGRKLFIVVAGMLLGDNDMACPTKSMPNVKFSDDMQTMYGHAWTGAEVVYAGHQGVKPDQEDWGPYEHLQPAEWPGNTGENYRRCCTSICWVGEALAIRMLKAEKLWDHDAFLDYCDRWMNEDDTEHIRIIREQRGQDYSADYNRGRQTWYAVVNEMYAKYRPTFSAPMDGWKVPHEQP